MRDFKDLLVQNGYRAGGPLQRHPVRPGHRPDDHYTEGKRIDHTRTRSGARAVEIYDRLVAAARDLLKLAQASQGRPNKDLAKFADQIRNLIQKWQ